MKLEHVKMLEDHPDYYRLHDGQSEFHVVKHGLSPGTLKKLQAHFAEGGQVQSPGAANYKENNTPDRGRLIPPGNSPIGNASENNRGWNPVEVQPKSYKVAAPVRMADGGMLDNFELNVHPIDALADTFSSAIAPVANVAQPQMPPPAPVEPSATQGPGMLARLSDAEMSAPPGLPPAPPPGFPSSPAVSPDEIQQNLNEGLSATQKMGRIAQQQANVEADYMQQAEAQKAKLNEDFQGQMKAHQERQEQMYQDVLASKIDPNKYWNDHSRIVSAIGLVLGGIGAGLARTPNFALELLNKNIDRDLEAQRGNLQNKTTLLNQYMQQGRDMMAAHQLAKADMLDMTAGQLQKAAISFGGDKSQAVTDYMASQMKNQSMQLRLGVENQQLDLTTKRMMLGLNAAKTGATMALVGGNQGGGGAPAGGGTPGGLRGGVRLMPQQAALLGDERLVNLDDGTYALARTPKDAEEITSLLDETRNYQRVLAAYQDLYRKHPHGVFSTTDPEDYGRAQGLYSQLIGGANKIGKLQRLTDTEIENVYHPMIPDITSKTILSSRTKGQLDELQRQINSRNWAEAQSRLLTKLPGMP